MGQLPHTLDLPAEPGATEPLLALLREVCLVAGTNSIRLQCVLPESDSLSSQWSIVSGDPHVVGATALSCLNECEGNARAILIVGNYHVSLRSTSSGYTATITESADGSIFPEIDPGQEKLTRELGIPLDQVINSLSNSVQPNRSPVGQFKNEVRRHSGDEVPDDDRMIDSWDSRS